MRKKYPKIQVILLIVNVAMLLVLLGGLNVLRIFETSFIRQTELELNAQAAFITSIYKEAYAKAIGQRQKEPLRILEEEVEWEPLVSQLDRAFSPVLDEAPKPLPFDSQLRGAEISDVELSAGESIIRILQAAQRRTLASMRVVNKQGVVVSSTNLNKHISLANRPEVLAALNGEYQAVLRRRTLTHKSPSAHSISRRADIRVHVVHPIRYRGEVIGAAVLARTPPSLSQLMERHRVELCVYVFIIFLFIWLLSLFTSYTIRKPLVALVEQARRAEQGEKGAVVALANPVSHEISELSHSVASMAESLEKRADYLLEFASHISHEFKTPVTAIQGATELLLDHCDTMTEQERNKFLLNLHGDTEHLENLVRRLLEFARADLKKMSSQSCNVNTPLNTIVQAYRAKNITVDIQGDMDTSINIHMAEEDFSRIVGNLIDNAIQANANNILLRSGKNDAGYELSMIDDGDAISKANQAKIFTPFFTLNKNSGGTGLGLSIISSLLNACGGQVSLTIDDDKKVFVINIPLAL